MSSLSSALALAHQMADQASAIAMKQFRQSGEVINKSKTGFDPTTATDIAIEKMMRKKISEHFPNHAIHGEELGQAQSASDQPCWILDPIDGTRNYYAGSLFWGILIALVENHQVRLGVIDHPTTGERFFAEGQQGFWRQGDKSLPLQSSANQELSTTVLAATTPQMFEQTELQAFNQISKQARITLYGGNCYFYGLLALGQIDLVIESSLNPYDIAALVPVVEAAGGKITNWQGTSPLSGGQVIAAANPALHEQALALLAPAAQSHV